MSVSIAIVSGSGKSGKAFGEILAHYLLFRQLSH